MIILEEEKEHIFIKVIIFNRLQYFSQYLFNAILYFGTWDL